MFLFDSGVDINVYLKIGIIFVFVVCENGNEKIVEYLLKYGLMINYINIKDEISFFYKVC